MNEHQIALSTFERSCQHWSEHGREEMDAFYRLATIDYRLLAERLNWGQVFEHVQRRFGAPLDLLDVACGSGQFPKALLEHGTLDDCADLSINYSLLDPSDFSIATAKQNLSGPFHPADELCCTLQDIPITDKLFPVIWATHALYCVPVSELGLAIDQLLSVFDPRGLGFIAHASHASHYLGFHQRYIDSHGAGKLEPYCSGEQIADVLDKRLDGELLRWSIDYVGQVGFAEQQTVEKYLQRCLFDDQLTLAEMLETPGLADYLHSCRNEQAGMWQFPQRVWLLFFGELKSLMQGCLRAKA